METQLQNDLLALPNKISAPLIHLLKNRQVDPESIKQILKAGQISRQPEFTLAFAIAYFSMEAEAVPVSDTIDMSIELGETIDLAWSPRRWEDEHQRMGRVVTLKRLSEDDHRYDVDFYAGKLPNTFAGYLIKHSRRLGMEGLRQRHCVAAYHERVSRGECAIATVFVNKQRFTVELRRAESNLIALVQVKGKGNKNPSSENRACIAKELGVNPVTKPMYIDETNVRYQSNLSAVLEKLREHHVTSANVDFESVGYRGSIEECYFHGGSSDVATKKVVQAPKLELYQARDPDYVALPARVDLESAMFNIVEDVIELREINLCSPRPFDGIFTIHVATGTAEVTMDYHGEEPGPYLHEINTG